MLCVDLSSMVEVGSALLVAACYLPPAGSRQLELHTEWPVAPHPALHPVLAPDDHPSAPAPSSSQQLVAEKSAFGPARRGALRYPWSPSCTDRDMGMVQNCMAPCCHTHGELASWKSAVELPCLEF